MANPPRSSGNPPNGESGPGARTGAPRRLGGQQPPARKQPPRANAKAPARVSSGAQRRQARARQGRSRSIGWVIVAVVVIAIGTIIGVNLSGSSKHNGSVVITGADRNPALAPASMVKPVTTVPASVFDRVGTDGQAPGFVVTKNQPPLTSGGKPHFVYVGAEYCPYCAAMRWSLVASLSRFGTFSGLKESASSPTDGNIPTFSFLGANYSSKYVAFSPYEQADRLGNPLQTVPANIMKLYTTYDGNGTTPTKFSPGGTGIPFLDLGNKYVSSGDPPYLAVFFGNGTGPLVNGGPGVTAIAQAVHNPFSSVGKGIQASGFIAEANYISAAICNLDHMQPGSVCHSPGVTAAAAQLAKATPVG